MVFETIAKFRRVSGMTLQKDQRWRIHKGLPVIVTIRLDCYGQDLWGMSVDFTNS